MLDYDSPIVQRRERSDAPSNICALAERLLNDTAHALEIPLAPVTALYLFNGGKNYKQIRVEAVTVLPAQNGR